MIGFELQARGHTADIDRPLSLDGMAVEMFRLPGGDVFGDALAGLPNSQPAILSRASHVSLASRTELLVPTIDSFLEAPHA